MPLPDPSEAQALTTARTGGQTPPASGLFVTLEGGEGAGKSTQARLLAEVLRARGLPVCLTREPGGTPGAEALREVLLFGKADFSPRAEIMTHMAARCDHLDRLILPALTRGEIVICDRFHDSTLAYQGYGQGRGSPAELAFIASLRKLLNREPDLTFWLDVPQAVATERLRKRRESSGAVVAGGAEDRYEQQDTAFHGRVHAGFATIAARDPERVRRIDGLLKPDEVTRMLVQQVLVHWSDRNGALPGKDVIS
ncbi:dTMP kinase [Oecophyllibacter saccharovorans]|uniref:dTMP kinase n=1 Tax=Oecophyllibacter saccharovorans TaxID=2558360 RepID=UPI001144DA41|nr:dTMP kinase [Oecophyllibacter saccharovorans]QDH15890.1 dTMP kinase [Oecophyllibacter saccharovorans]TPW34787.1 dTMP kinase [Oecophyllibacter saccharovorans]